MSARSVVIGTAGHIDHGKSTLVRALTGIDPDRLPEERLRGITIDLGFAHRRHAGIDLAFVDVPGHERFVHNMLAGTGSIDRVLLVVAADESVMPQTREHLAITRLLRVPVAAVALTRIDLAEPELRELAAEDLRRLLGEWGIEAPIVPVSAISGEGLEPLLDQLVASKPESGAAVGLGWSRLAIDRVFSAKGFGAVVTGTLQGGELRVGDPVSVLPAGFAARVRGLQIHGVQSESAPPHSRVAVNLQGIEHHQLARGMTLVPSGHELVCSSIDAWVELWNEAPAPLSEGQTVRFHHLSAESSARLRLPNSGPLLPGQSGPVQIRFESPLALVPGDRFVLRRASPLNTLAGGEVLQLDPPRHRKADDWRASFQALVGAAPMVRLEAALRQRAERGLAIPSELLQFGLTGAEWNRAAPGAGRIVALGSGWIVSPEAESESIERLRRALSAHHRRHPLEPGPTLEQLHSTLRLRWSIDALRALVERAAKRGGVELEAGRARLGSHRPERNAALEAPLERMVQALDRAGMEALSEERLVAAAGLGSNARELIAHALRQQLAVRLPDSLIISIAAWNQVVATLRERSANGEERVDVRTFKELFGLTRRVAIPLLERLDDQGITQRIGNERRVRQSGRVGQ